MRILAPLLALSVTATAANAELAPAYEQARILETIIQVVADRMPDPITSMIETQPGIWRVSGEVCAMTLGVEYMAPETVEGAPIIGPAPFRLRIIDETC